MNKRALHHMLVGLRQLRVRELTILLVALVLIGAFFLRQNNLHMITLRNQALQADEQNKDIPKALANLHNYVVAHMNASMGDQGIYLEHSYHRSYAAAITAAAQGGSDSAVIYQNAEKVCTAQFDPDAAFLSYAQCAVAKVAASGAPPISTPSADLYRFNFVAPAWSPDLAGFTLLTAVLVGILLVGQMVLRAVLYTVLRANR